MAWAKVPALDDVWNTATPLGGDQGIYVTPGYWVAGYTDDQVLGTPALDDTWILASPA